MQIKEVIGGFRPMWLRIFITLFFCQMLKLSVPQGARKIERRKERKKIRKKDKRNDTKKGNGKKYEEENGKEERKM